MREYLEYRLLAITPANTLELYDDEVRALCRRAPLVILGQDSQM